MRAMRLDIRGRVQGVGYRWFARDAAVRLGLCGWVQNEPDGGVTVHAEGADAALQVLLAACRRGPSSGWVDDVAVSWPEPPVGYTSFEIRT